MYNKIDSSDNPLTVVSLSKKIYVRDWSKINTICMTSSPSCLLNCNLPYIYQNCYITIVFKVVK